MKPRHYLAIAVRLFAVFLFLYSIQQSRTLLELIINGYANEVALPIWFGIAVSLLPLLASLLLWFFPLTVSQFILTDEINQPIEPINIQSLLAVFIIAIGLYYFYYAISDTIYWVTLWKMSSLGTHDGIPISLPSESTVNIITTAFELAISLVFIFRAKTLAYHLLRLTA